MKAKLFLPTVLLAFITLASSASPIKIIIRGGGTNNRYYEVVVLATTIKCTGAGNNVCPINFSSAQSKGTGTWYPLNDINDFVQLQVKNGQLKGDVKYKRDLPVQWRLLDDENIEITIDCATVKGLDEYDSKF